MEKDMAYRTADYDQYESDLREREVTQNRVLMHGSKPYTRSCNEGK